MRPIIAFFKHLLDVDSCSLSGSVRGAYNSVCAKAQKNLYMLAPNPPVRAQIPVVFRKNYKTAGIGSFEYYF